MSTTGFTLSGEGEADINGGSPVQVLFWWAQITLPTSPRVRFSGTMFPRRLMYGGQIAFRTNLDTTEYSFGHGFQWEKELWFFPTLADSRQWITGIAWRIPVGVEWTGLVDWTT
jgi:hypothetical protein